MLEKINGKKGFVTGGPETLGKPEPSDNYQGGNTVPPPDFSLSPGSNSIEAGLSSEQKAAARAEGISILAEVKGLPDPTVYFSPFNKDPAKILETSWGFKR